MIHKRTLVIAGAILALGASLEAAISVGYYTDGVVAGGGSKVTDTAPAAPIAQNGFLPIQITDIAAFVAAGNLRTISILMIDEINVEGRGPTQDLFNQSTALSAWVAGGGVIAIHDRNVCTGPAGLVCTPVPGLGVSPVSSQSDNIDVETAGTLVTNGPFGVIGNTTLDNGGSSNHGFAVLATLPSGAVGILNDGTPTQEVAFSYRFGLGWVYYSTIPLDFFLDGFGPPAFHTIYAPNMVAYLGCLATGVCLTTGIPGGATAAPTLSQWGLGILAILLMACAAVMLRSGQAKGPAR